MNDDDTLDGNDDKNGNDANDDINDDSVDVEE